MQELFPILPLELRQSLARLPQALEAVLPLHAAHRRLLPIAIEELSTRLTSERGVGSLPYWSAPRLTAAYLWYFLPWNILRLTRLFSGLGPEELPPPTPLPLHPGAEARPRVLVDMGSGPLSLPLALWLAKPQWRQMPLTLLCLDNAPRPLELGQKLFAHVAGPDSPWRIVTVRASLDMAGRELSRLPGVPWLITAANVLNELKGRAHEHGVDERLEGLIAQLPPLLEAPDARALLIEPGTRLGGKTMLTLRQAALDMDLLPCSPCSHTAPCPLEDSRTWCHFTFDTDGAPTWLKDLSQAAHLRKDALSLSFLLLRTSAPEALPPDTQGRIISAPFSVPNMPGAARYACTARGLALLSRAGGLPSGSLVRVRHTENPAQDRKSGAFILEHDERVPDTPLPAHRPHIHTDVPKPAAPARPARPAKPKPKKKAPLVSKKKPAPKFWEK